MIWLLTPITIIIGLNFAVQGQWFLVLNFGIFSPAIFWLPRFLYRLPQIRRFFNDQWRIFFERFILAGYLLTAGGTLGLYRAVPKYDTLVHVLVFIFLSLMTAQLYAGVRVMQNREVKLKTAVLLIVIMTIIVGPGWELFQKTTDTLIGTSMFRDYFQTIEQDVTFDILADFLGMIIGLVLVTQKWPGFYRSVLRIEPIKES